MLHSVRHWWRNHNHRHSYEYVDTVRKDLHFTGDSSNPNGSLAAMGLPPAYEFQGRAIRRIEKCSICGQERQITTYMRADGQIRPWDKDVRIIRR